MMKAVIFNGSPQSGTALEQAGRFLEHELGLLNWETSFINLRDLKFTECQGCFKCWDETPGVCHTDDDGRELCRQLAQSELMVLLTPISFGGYGSLLKRALERAVLPVLLPYLVPRKGEIHHPLRYGKAIRAMAIGSLPQADTETESLFQNVLYRNSLNCDSPIHPTAVVYEKMETNEIQQKVRVLIETLEKSYG
jgi:multimeric flavodoxin WrbA